MVRDKGLSLFYAAVSRFKLSVQQLEGGRMSSSASGEVPNTPANTRAGPGEVAPVA